VHEKQLEQELTSRVGSRTLRPVSALYFSNVADGQKG